MKQLIDYIPLLVFFIVWNLEPRMVTLAGVEREIGGIFSAAEFLLASSVSVSYTHLTLPTICSV